MEWTLRALMPENADAARTILAERLGDTRYLTRNLEQLDAALQFDDPEYMALLAEFPDGALGGLVIFGTVSGARGVTRIHGAMTRDDAALVPLLDAVREACVRSGERLIMCEVPDDEPFATLASALATGGFVEEGCVTDYVSDGVGLRLLVWRSPS